MPDHNYKKEFEEIRNRAIHIGHLPNKQEAKKAYEIAKNVLDTLVLDRFEECNK